MLFEAIEYNEQETAHILLEQSAHYATTHQQLAEHRALLNARSPIFLDTPLHASLRHRRFDLTNYILRYYPDMTSGDHLGKYPLQAAAYAHAPEEIFIRLLRQDATTTTVNHADDNGYTALHDAAIHADGTTIALLLANGAHLERCEQIYNRTPLYLAAIHGNYSAAQALLRAGANPVAHIENTPTILNATLSALTHAKNAQREQNAQLPESQEERYQHSIEPLTQTALLFIRECDQLFTDPKIIQEIVRDARACDSPEIMAALQIRGIDMTQSQKTSTHHN
ncbi:MAG: ankyrin repeat domain-containing protein [Methylophilaceae bacterium]|nr:ankyrin repeat domain-containing protein [Methylophilaceae bacterium]